MKFLKVAVISGFVLAAFAKSAVANEHCINRADGFASYGSAISYYNDGGQWLEARGGRDKYFSNRPTDEFEVLSEFLGSDGRILVAVKIGVQNHSGFSCMHNVFRKDTVVISASTPSRYEEIIKSACNEYIEFNRSFVLTSLSSDLYGHNTKRIMSYADIYQVTQEVTLLTYGPNGEVLGQRDFSRVFDEKFSLRREYRYDYQNALDDFIEAVQTRIAALNRSTCQVVTPRW